MTSAPHDVRTYAPEPEIYDDEIDLGDLIGVLIENRWLILIITLASFLLGLTYTFVATPIYKADALIQVEEKKSGLGDLDINALFEGDTSTTAEIEILRSRLVLGAVVENLNLDITAEPNHFPIFGAALARRPERAGATVGAAPRPRHHIQVDTLNVPAPLIGQQLTLTAGSGSRYELLGPEDEHLLHGTVGEAAEATVLGEPLSIFVSQLQADEGDEFHLARQTNLKTIEDLQASLSISEKGKGSGILAISLQGKSPADVSEQVNEIANVYVRQNVERKSAEAQKTLAFLEEQLPVVKQDMETAEVALNTYRLEKGSVDLPLETQAILETIVAVEAQLNELRQERDKVTQGFTPAHPMVVALDKQIERLNGELNQLNDQVRELPNTQQEVLRLVRDTEVNTVLYTSLLNTAQELRVVKAGTVGNVRVVDYAVTPYRTVKPKKAMILMLSLMLGGFVGVVAAFVKRSLNGGVGDPELIEKQLNIPVYATIAHSKNQDRIYKKLQSKEAKRAILAIKHPDDISIESLGNLRTALHFGMMDAKNNCIMIAGPSPAVGKSFVSVNLAAVLASNDKKVLLIDGDMRRGHLHQYLGLERENGLSEFISGEVPIGKVLHATTIPGLTFIPTGEIPPNPAELLLHKRFTNCLSVLTPRFDHIIIDSPPILAVTDASIIGQMAGATLMVLKSGEHPMREIEQSAKRLRQAGVNLRGLLMNDINMQSQRYGAGKHYYQYSYSQK
jgi:tyrosine-protein kinase Etk/Wzc